MSYEVSTFFSPSGLHNQQTPASLVAEQSADVREVFANETPGVPDLHGVGGETGSRRVTPASDGRAVRVTPSEDAVLLDILSTRGNSMEGVWLDRAQLLGLIGILREAQQEADDLLEHGTARRRVERDRSYREALARNPWLNGTNDKLREERYR